jgi:muconolactone delta-isomerase
MRFLTKEGLKEAPSEEVRGLIPAEQAAMKELMKQGVVEAMYVSADSSTAWVVWDIESQNALEEVHRTLPLHDYLNSDIALLADRA